MIINNTKQTPTEIFQVAGEYYAIWQNTPLTFCAVHYASGMQVPNTIYKTVNSSKQMLKKVTKAVPINFSHYPIVNSISEMLERKENERLEIIREKQEAKLLEKEDYKIKYGTRSEENKKKAEKEIIRLEKEWMQMPMNRLTVNAKRCEEIVNRINNLKFV